MVNREHDKKRITVELRCRTCGDPLVFIPPTTPNMKEPCPFVSIQVQTCLTCAKNMALEMFKDMNPGWDSLNWMTYAGSMHDKDKAGA